ncbi:MAG TPA: hypothetical protein VHS58_16030, partial [Acetobacteraceae bacterium]|nr:hypothetical protein [Acetobacteraceae bacterium]
MRSGLVRWPVCPVIRLVTIATMATLLLAGAATAQHGPGAGREGGFGRGGGQARAFGGRRGFEGGHGFAGERGFDSGRGFAGGRGLNDRRGAVAWSAHPGYGPAATRSAHSERGAWAYGAWGPRA